MRAPDPNNPAYPENFQKVVEALSRLQPEIIMYFKNAGFQDCEDYCQEVMIRMVLIARKQEIRIPDAYIFRVCKNVRADAYEAQNKRQKRFPSADIDDCINDLSYDPFLLTQQKEDHDNQLALLHNELDTGISTADAELLFKRFWQNLSYKEIAQDFGCPDSRLRKRQQRLLKSLHKRLHSED